MRNWREIDSNWYGPVYRVAEVFQIGPPAKDLPISKFKIKVLERQDGSFMGIPNVALIDPNGNPDWVSGSGLTVMDALLDTLKEFYVLVDERGGGRINDFTYSDAGDF